ncbi:hypothetical protein Tsubulata_049541 [Turnera subulata]|uniref:Uncharacterized protein n=1 Tax=Turnera subulata TaxID=218843 RepID=A0A9Q0GG43_9ROSI|nr:hypothetical protein Tsubulata_049541 [Turnera subulata]
MTSVVSVAVDDTSSISQKQNFSSTEYNPFSPRASLIRYWNKHVSNNLPKPTLLHSVPLTRPSLPSSPPKLTLLSPRLLFLGQLELLLRFEAKPWQSTTNTSTSPSISNRRFTNYGRSRQSEGDSFKNYSNGLNSAKDSFLRYSNQATGHGE